MIASIVTRAADAEAVSGEVLFADDVIGEVRRIAIATPLASGLLWRPGQSIEVEVALARDGDAIHVVGSRLLVDRCVTALAPRVNVHALVTWRD